MKVGKQLAHPAAAGGIERGLGPIDLAQRQDSGGDAKATVGVRKNCLQKRRVISDAGHQNHRENARDGTAQLGGRHHEKQGAAPAGQA